ncbi:MFS transporter [Geodermatophilus ruber]|uniref:MFS transporter, CP family, cyanate transporter n=1 Tax=Geodermatophilus ruber TaxID=504800 RepID=A0A1I4HL46_9ACTN|nr:MFS transporter [Geodermatophilus ruber]SFL42912.1 MFS transporter, CP family, cyanate transporter [Geodermatophilus ruber]
MHSDSLPQARPDSRAGLRPVPGTGLLLAAVLLTGLNLRGAIAAVSPVLPEIRAELDLSPTVAGLLTTLPVLCFAALAPAAAWLGRRLGPGTAVLAGLVAVAAGTALRVLDGPAVLLAGTFLAGAGMTVGNVLLPAVTKREFAERAGTVTGLYTGALCAGAALMAALTAPLAALTGWRVALAAGAVLAVAAAVVWVAATRGRPGGGRPGGAEPGDAGSPGAPQVQVWRSGTAWAVGLVLALQSVLYYALTAWLPTVLIDGGIDVGAAALAATLFQVLGIPGTLVVPAVLARQHRARRGRSGRDGQRGLGVVVAAGWGVPLLGLLLAPAVWPLWTVVGGLAQGAGISLAFTLVVLRAGDDAVVRRLSGMSQLIGYSLGATGPLLAGALYAATGGWTAPLLLLLVLTGVLAAGLAVAGRPGSIGPKGLPHRGSPVSGGR